MYIHVHVHVHNIQSSSTQSLNVTCACTKSYSWAKPYMYEGPGQKPAKLDSYHLFHVLISLCTCTMYLALLTGNLGVVVLDWWCICKSVIKSNYLQGLQNLTYIRGCGMHVCLWPVMEEGKCVCMCVCVATAMRAWVWGIWMGGWCQLSLCCGSAAVPSYQWTCPLPHNTLVSWTLTNFALATTSCV